jgi:16S rRNA (guanine966-N2)-methyltransferase
VSREIALDGTASAVIMCKAICVTMRVIAGKAKGQRLKSLRGSGLRPTSDLLRGAIFSMLESMAADWSRVLDLYAGTGALGIEALSRGAEWADFVERNPRLCAVIKENLEHTGFTAQGAVYCLSAEKALSVLDEVYGILLLDPPYADPAISATAEKLSGSRLVGEDSTIVIEHSKRTAVSERYGNFCQVKSIRHGDSCVSVYQYAGGEA